MITVFLAGCAPTRQSLPPPILTIGKPKPTYTAPPLSIPPPPVYTAPQPTRGVTIVVDAGHGGHDPGTRGTGFSILPEKTINLLIAQELARNLQVRGANVVLTRTGDWFLELSDRAARGDAVGASLFISIHCDAARNAAASGMTIYIGRNARGGSERAAQCIDSAVRNVGLESRGVRRANYKVLRESNRAAVLIECGFLTNFGDARALNAPYHRARIAAAIAQGIANYYGW